MKTKHFILYILFCCSTFLLNAQSNANWQLNRIIVKAGHNNNITSQDIAALNGFYAQNTISDSKGNLLFYTKEDSVFAGNNKMVINGFDLYLKPYRRKSENNINISSSCANFIRINTDKYVLVYNTFNNDLDTGALMYSIIERNINNWEITSKNNVLKIGISGFMNINRNPDGSYGMVTRFDNTLYNYKIENGSFTLKDSIYRKTDINPDENRKYIYPRYNSEKMIFNSFGNEGYFFDEVYSYNNMFNDTSISYNFKLYKFILDKKLDKFISVDLLDSSFDLKYFHGQKSSYYREYLGGINEIILMPNDSILLLPVNDLKSNIDSFSIVIFNVKTQSKEKIRYIKKKTYLKLISSGKILSLENTIYNGNFNYSYIYRTHSAEQIVENKLSEHLDTFSVQYSRYRTGDNILFYSSYQLFDYLRIEPEINYSCDSVTVKLKNLTNLSNGINDFRFYVCKDSACNQVDSFRTFEPIVSFTKNGKYPYKVYGYSPSQSGYGEWYYDTIVVDNKMKVHADFSVSDSLVCRFKEVNFTNKSIASDTNILGIISSHWYFANEKDTQIFGDNQDIKYAFTQTGIRNIKLIFSNGFCTDTFTQNITVIDAPMPGFSVNNLVGCTPFDLVINDTITRFVSQKEYYNSYKNSWDTIPLNQFNFTLTFPDIGNYFIIQKLIGANNCVTIRDTANIIIRPGITNQDSTQIFYASYLNNQNIELIWNANSAARNYNLFTSKDGNNYQNILETNDTFYTHNIQNPQTIYYTVKAIDSCGTATITSNFAKPIFLETNLFGQNEKAMLDFTAYEKWQQNIQNYNVYVLDSFGNTQQVYITNPTHFEDENITEYDLSKICYQISTPHPTLNKEIKSNTSCINVLPTIFIPNSFTPNNDGLNEAFYPSILGIESYDLYIYNRWGQLVGNFNKNNHWTGKNNPEGIYIYYIRAKTSTGKIINGKGNITLLR